MYWNEFIFAFDVWRTQHIILRFLWCSVRISVVLKGDLLWYSFRRTSAFSALSWIIYLMGTIVLNTINLTYSRSNGCVAQWIMRCTYTLNVSGSIPAGWDLFLFFVVVLFCFEEAFCSISLLGNNVTFVSKPKKARTHFLEVVIERGSAAVRCDANRTKTVCRTVEHMNFFLLKSIT